MFEWTAFTILVVIGGGLVALVVRYFLFRLGCILADLNDPALGRSILVVVVVALLTLPLGCWVAVLLSRLENSVADSSHLIFFPGLTLYAVVAWIVSATFYSVTLASTYKKSLIVAGTELLLTGLLAALVTAIVMVGLAGWQISRRAPSTRAELLPRHNPPACVLALDDSAPRT